MKPRSWTFQSRSDPDKDYLVQDGSDGLWCNCAGFENHETCWHVRKVWGQLEYEKMRAKKTELTKIRTGNDVFKQMVADREVIYQELERKRLLYHVG